MSPEELFGFDKTNLKVWSISLFINFNAPTHELRVVDLFSLIKFFIPEKNEFRSW